MILCRFGLVRKFELFVEVGWPLFGASIACFRLRGETRGRRALILYLSITLVFCTKTRARQTTFICHAKATIVPKRRFRSS